MNRVRGCALLASLLLAGCSGEGGAQAPRLPAASERADAPRPLAVRWVGEPDAGGPLLVLLHGYGAPGDDLVPLAEALREGHEGELRVVVPEAPLARPPSGRAWWHVDLSRSRPADRSGEAPPGMAEARRDVIALLARLRREGRLEPSRTVIAGFSQGAMLSLDVALEHEAGLAGVAALSGGPVDRARWRARMDERAPARVFLSHGRADALLSFEAAERLRAELARAGADVTWVPFDGGHAIPPTVRGALGAWLADLR